MAMATVSTDCITVVFEANLVQTDYGVPGSPVWDEVEDVEIDSLEILGVEVDPKTLPTALVNAILRLADEAEFEE
jgi:hypothetical protein